MGGFKPSRKLLILQAMEQDRKRKEELERKHRGYDVWSKPRIPA